MAIGNAIQKPIRHQQKTEEKHSENQTLWIRFVKFIEKGEWLVVFTKECDHLFFKDFLVGYDGVYVFFQNCYIYIYYLLYESCAFNKFV